MNLTLDLAPYVTDITACQRCRRTVTLGDTVRCTDGFRVCFECVLEAVEEHHLAAVADRYLPVP
ncbi:hypothetical protein ACFV1N_46975 [Streptosporangium canum]|uniref:hypothetical protein n=1 Tax=Streptosporangium canum TaxID=324952 RepID=UPI0036A88DF8